MVGLAQNSSVQQQQQPFHSKCSLHFIRKEHAENTATNTGCGLQQRCNAFVQYGSAILERQRDYGTPAMDPLDTPA